MKPLVRRPSLTESRRGKNDLSKKTKFQLMTPMQSQDTHATYCPPAADRSNAVAQSKEII